MSEKRSKRDCGKDKSLGAPGPLPDSCLATYRDVFLATEYAQGGEAASVEAVKDELKILFSKVTPTLSVIKDKSVVQKIYRCCESVKRFRMNKMTAYQKQRLSSSKILTAFSTFQNVRTSSDPVWNLTALL